MNSRREAWLPSSDVLSAWAKAAVVAISKAGINKFFIGGCLYVLKTNNVHARFSWVYKYVPYLTFVNVRRVKTRLFVHFFLKMFAFGHSMY